MLGESIEFSPLDLDDFESPYTHIWLLDVAQLADIKIIQGMGLLSKDEKLKADGLKFNKNNYIVSRVLIRQALSYYTHISAKLLEFSRTPKGKPFLVNSPRLVKFNVSHSGNYIAIIICNHAQVGIDIEVSRPRKFIKIADQYFHPREVEQILACSDAYRESLFYRLWTLKEALLKATGGGISSGLANVQFNLSGSNISATFSKDLGLLESEWQFQQYQLSLNCWCALAVNCAQPVSLQWIDGVKLFDTIYTD